MGSITIRPVLAADEDAWRELWRGYCEFYRVDLGREVTDRTWKRLLAGESGFMCMIAEVDSRVCGFANCVVHGNTWELQPVCYLEDLFVAPDVRGRGVGKALIAWLRNSMQSEGWARVYWMTHKDNAAARSLYDRFTQADEFVRYVMRAR